MDPGERDLFERSVRAVLERHRGPALERELRALGWHEALRAEPPTAVGVLFELQGLLNATSPLDPVLRSVLGPGGPDRPVVLPRLGSRDAPAVWRAGAVEVDGLGTSAMTGAVEVLVPVRGETGTELVCLRAARLDLQPASGLDPALGLVRVGGTVEPVGPVAPAGPADDDAWPRAVARGQLALAHELVGASSAMLALARDHALDRVQFGRPVASFQAVRHRLADGLVAVEAGRASVDAAWEEGTVFSAGVAKAVTGRGARVVARHAQQVLAGLGFTADHPLHRYVKRTVVLDQLLGSSGVLARWVGEELVRAGALPPALPL